MRKNIFCAALALIGLASCNNEADLVSPDPSGETVYMQVAVSLPSSGQTRTTSPSSTTEIGKDVENKVSSLTVYLVNTSTNVMSSPIPASTSGLQANGYYTTNPFPTTALTKGDTYKVYVVVNEGTTITGVNDGKTVSDINFKSTGSIAEADKFMMTGVGSGTVTVDRELPTYTKDNPFDAGLVKVERAVARFDYKQGVVDDAHNVDAATITIKSVALINVSNSFYYFKRVSDDGRMDGLNMAIGGAETATNYVIDHNWDTKTTSGTYFLNYMTGALPYGGATYTELVSLSDEDNTWEGGEASLDKGGYKIWTYCTENTIAAPTSKQINGLSTGVVFKAQITGGAFNAADDGDKVYILHNKVVGDWTAVLASADTDVKNAIAGLDPDETKNTPATLQNAGFTRYTADASGNYYAYYIYWNQHNNNGNPDAMGAMEFAVVRNNVYKLSVTEITKFGHPNDPINPDPTDPDPDPEYPVPTDPDEDENIYMKVKVEILPWTVRVNDIQF
ncbi:Mfa1 family fimbria major subunit [Bacteroides sp. UBA939]|uniref:Mfa1 family fimbria major subunit n=1 Tax=Bacteroides sp. UBA939 TaxID=1946092 RepID=UPI0025C28410|nr:Mfa1 family fimbria major subunit [Bacteroides sp. UBA939]